MPSNDMLKSVADVVIVVALDDEATPFRESPLIKWESVTSPFSVRHYHLGSLPNGLSLALAQTSGMGQLNAAALTADVINDFNPLAIVLCGICASWRSDAKPGDVFVSELIVDYELMKQDGVKSRREWKSYEVDSGLLNAFQQYIRPFSESTVSASNTGIFAKCGAFLCGNKILASFDVKGELAEHYPRAVALEMESAGVAAIVSARPVNDRPQYIAVKAAQDSGDENKTDEYRKLACQRAADFVLGVLSQATFSSSLRRRSSFDAARLHQRLHARLSQYSDTRRALITPSRELLDAVITAALIEAKGALYDDYRVDISHGHQFLLRAKPLFERASSLLAVSLDSVSTFWTREADEPAAISYLKSHSADACRLFVFNQADMAHHYARILDAHSQQYSGVYVTSRRHYETLLRGWCAGVDVDEWLKHDFGILRFDELPEDKIVFAKLSEHQLHYERVNDNAISPIRLDEVRLFFERCSRIPTGEIDNGILHWGRGIWQNQTIWARQLRSLFDERAADVFHLIFFRFAKRHSEADVRKLLATVKERVLGAKGWPGRYGLKSVWFGSSCDFENPVRDAKYRGELRIGDRGGDGWLLLMRFDSQDGLERFYQDDGHSDLRREVYQSIDEKVGQLLSVADGLREKGDKAIVFEGAEALVSKYIERRDYRDDEMIEEMVRVPPHHFRYL